MKLLNGKDLADFIKERQAKQVRNLKQTYKTSICLAIVVLKDDPVINTYVNLKKRYGADIGVAVIEHRVNQSKAKELIKKLNTDPDVNGIIVQLPISDPDKTEEIVNLVSPAKDVDALGKNSILDPATPMAIMWLLAGYNIDLRHKKIVLIGKGRLVGEPLAKIFKQSGYDFEVIDRGVQDLKSHTLEADLIITATGRPAILYADMIKPNAVVVDAGVASEDGKTVGDLADEVYERDDLTITPKKGGVGPLTVCALFENVINTTQKKYQSTS